MKEIQLQKHFFSSPVETIYFGGGTPSIIHVDEVKRLLEELEKTFQITANPEITLEANPEHLTKNYLKELSSSGVNRLSVGVQTFDENSLKWMGRAHTVLEAKNALHNALELGFDNLTADLIFGLPEVNVEEDLNEIVTFNLSHLSAYALTVEPNTPLAVMINRGRIIEIDEEKVIADFEKVMQMLAAHGYEQYELSNYSKPGCRSKHNTSYWQQKPYLGLGPSAHSYNGTQRFWNVSNVTEYIQQVNQEVVPHTCETLDASMRYNEYLMTALRTSEGVDMTKLQALLPLDVGADRSNGMELVWEAVEKYIQSNHLLLKDNSCRLTHNGKYIADAIIADLFIV